MSLHVYKQCLFYISNVKCDQLKINRRTLNPHDRRHASKPKILIRMHVKKAIILKTTGRNFKSIIPKYRQQIDLSNGIFINFSFLVDQVLGF